MSALIISAILLGVLLNFISIGPAFFMLIETSFSKGIKSAVILNLGIILSDVVYILLAYFSSAQIIQYLRENPLIFQISGIIIGSFGIFMIFSKATLQFKGEMVSSKNYLKLIVKGFLINFTNLGVLVFWIPVTLIASSTYEKFYKISIYFLIALLVFFLIDLMKIFLAKKIYKRINEKFISIFRKCIGIILFFSGIALFSKSFISFDKKIKSSDKKILEFFKPR